MLYEQTGVLDLADIVSLVDLCGEDAAFTINRMNITRIASDETTLGFRLEGTGTNLVGKAYLADRGSYNVGYLVASDDVLALDGGFRSFTELQKAINHLNRVLFGIMPNYLNGVASTGFDRECFNQFRKPSNHEAEVERLYDLFSVYQEDMSGQ
ncbi:MAG: hypothetical protein R6V53_00785 [Candidatus Woesearchaeota archaeon]